MSTELTTSPLEKLVMVESHSLKLAQCMEIYRTKQVIWILERLAKRGFPEINDVHLAFFGVLDCDDNFAAEIARRLNVTRQAVHKTVRELEGLGFLKTVANEKKKNSRIIQITGKGEKLIFEARNLFAELDQHLLANMQLEDIERMGSFFLTDLPE